MINNFLARILFVEPHSDPEKDRILTGNIYGLHLLAVTVFMDFFAFIAVLLNFARFFAVKGSWLESHFRYQIQTFWTALFFAIAVILSFFVWNGWLTLAGFIIWYLIRVWKGYAAYRQKAPVIGSWFI
jgi:uncharacterized membrane protein